LMLVGISGDSHLCQSCVILGVFPQPYRPEEPPLEA
jgi:hypothetical protein